MMEAMTSVKPESRFRFTIAAGLIAILILGVILAIAANIWRERRREQLAYAELIVQADVTREILGKARDELRPTDVAISSSGMGSARSGNHWSESITMGGDGRRTFMSLEIRGLRERGTLFPIQIISGKGELDPEIIRRLVEEYGKRKWKFAIDSPSD